MTFVIAGATGNTGKVVAEALLAHKKSVRLIARDPTKLSGLSEQGAEVVAADLGDTQALAQALRGAEGAYLLVPPNYAAADFRAYQDKTITSIVAALRASPVPHVVFLSSVGAQHEEKTGPIAALYSVEKQLRDIPGVKATLLRAGYFIENLAGSLGMLDQGILPSFFAPDFGIDMVATADIGRVAANLLIEGTSEHQVVELGGPPRTMRQAAEALSKLTGKPIEVNAFPLEAMVGVMTGMGLSEDMAKLYQEMTGSIIDGRVAFEGGHKRLQSATSLEEVLRPLIQK